MLRTTSAITLFHNAASQHKAQNTSAGPNRAPAGAAGKARGTRGTCPRCASGFPSLSQVSHHPTPLSSARPAPANLVPAPPAMAATCHLPSESHQLPGRCWWPQDPPFLQSAALGRTATEARPGLRRAQLMLQKCAACILVVTHTALGLPFFSVCTCQNSSPTRRGCL